MHAHIMLDSDVKKKALQKHPVRLVLCGGIKYNSSIVYVLLSHIHNLNDFFLELTNDEYGTGSNKKQQYSKNT